MRGRLFIVILVGLTLTGCSPTQLEEDDIGDLAEIAESDPVIEFDPSGTSATVRITTTVNAVCAVTYGIDGPFGSIATARDMGAGGGHSDHQAVMTGLQPATEYQYQLQGVAADGKLYRSEVRTFTTPSATTGAFGFNVAIGAEVRDASSEFSVDFVAANAVDGDFATEWSSLGDGDEAFITIDLGGPVAIKAVGFRTRTMGDGSATTETFTVEVDSTVYGPFPLASRPRRWSSQAKF